MLAVLNRIFFVQLGLFTGNQAVKSGCATNNRNTHHFLVKPDKMTRLHTVTEAEVWRVYGSGFIYF